MNIKAKKDLINDLDQSWDAKKHIGNVPYRESDRKELEKLLNIDQKESKSTSVNVKEGDVMSCKVVAVTDKNVIMETGLKSEGIIPVQEFIESCNEDVKIGNVYELMVMNLETEKGVMTLSRKQAVAKRHWDSLCKAVSDEDSVVTGIPFKKTGGGFRVGLGFGIEGFLPNSQTGMSSSDEFEKSFLYKECQFRPISIGTNIVLSTKDLIASSRADKKKEVMERLKVGLIVDGIVKSITAFGVFVSVDGVVDGLIRLPNLSYKRIKTASEIDITEGKPIKVIVLSNENNLISFGLKQLMKNPWEEVEFKFPIGSSIVGKAVNIMHYGIFVEVAPGIEGLVHFSEMPISQPISTLHEIISLGDTVEATVIYANNKTNKLSLSMIRDQHESINWSQVEKKYAVGTKHNAVVKSLLKRCAIVELEAGVAAQIHSSDIAKEPCQHSSNLLGIGEKVLVRVLRISKSTGFDQLAPRKIVVGIRQAAMENWEEESLKEGSFVQATVIRITPFGAIVATGGKRGYIHVSEMSRGATGKSNVADFVSVGDVVKGTITNVDLEQNMINISMIKAMPDEDIQQFATTKDGVY